MHRMRHVRGSAIGSVSSKRVPPLGPASRLDRSAMRVHYRAADREAEPRADDGALALAALELFEQLRRVAWRQTRAVVVDRHAHERSVVRRGDLDVCAARRVLRRVVEQVAEHLHDERRVDEQRPADRPGSAPRRDAPRAGLRTGASAAPTSRRDARSSRRNATSPASKRMRSSTFETSSDISRAFVSIECASATRGRFVEARAARRERAAGAGHHRERRAQVVRDRREQRIAQALGLRGDARRLPPSRRAARAPAASADLPCERLEQVALLGQQHTPAIVAVAPRARRASRGRRRAAGTARARPATCRMPRPARRP